MTAGSHFCGGDDQQGTFGIACSHAYTTLGCMELDVGGGEIVKLVKVRNPWGEEQYYGPWSDSDN